MISESTRPRNPAGHAGLLENTLALASALVEFFESRFVLIAQESKTAAVQVMIMAGCLILALLLCHTDLNVIGLIGIILLIGIVKKNGIMMVDFALEAERQEGKAPLDAIYQACLLRFRPILMTTMAALLGGVPLALGSGTGSELRHPLGITMVGGLIFSQLLTLYTTPVIYLAFARLAMRWSRRKRDRAMTPASPVEAV